MNREEVLEKLERIVRGKTIFTNSNELLAQELRYLASELDLEED